MTKKLKIKLLIALSAAIAACTAAGCSVGRDSLDDITDGYDVHVVYYANGGSFSGMDICVKEIYAKCKDGEDKVPFFEIKEDSNFLTVGRSEYVFAGWYLPQTDENGNIMYEYTDAVGVAHPAHVKLDEDGEVVYDKEIRPVYVADGVEDDIDESKITVLPSSTPVNESVMVEKGKVFSVCAVWEAALRVEYVLVCDEGETYTDAEGNSYKNGDVIFDDAFGTSDYYKPKSQAPVKLKGASFAQTYADKELTKPGNSVSRSNPVVYSHYIHGDGWTVIKNAGDVAMMFNGLYDETNKYYFYDTYIKDKTIDCSNAGVTLRNGETYTTKATIEGNGCTLINLNVKNEQAAGKCSVFGAIGEQASISNLTIKNLSVSAKSRTSISFYAIWTELNEKATIKNLVIDGLKAYAEVSLDIYNITESNTSNWLFGGLPSGVSDEKFLEDNAEKISVININKEETQFRFNGITVKP